MLLVGLLVAVAVEEGVLVRVMMITMIDGIVILIRVPMVKVVGMMIAGTAVEVEEGGVVDRLQGLAVAGTAQTGTITEASRILQSIPVC